MLIILNGVVSVIGYRFKSEDFRNPENKKKIMYIIDQLGPLIPEMIDKLIVIGIYAIPVLVLLTICFYISN